MTDCAKPVVAHFQEKFFIKSEIFIYHQISHLKKFLPICIADEFINLDLFPFLQQDIYVRKSLFHWWNVPALTRFFGRDRAVESVMKSRGVRVLHAHFGPSGVYALNVKRYTGLPLITTFYGLDVSFLARLGRWKSQYRQLFREGDLFLAEGPHMRSELIKLGCPVDKLRIQRIMIPVDRIAFRPRTPKLSREKVVLLFSGRWVEKKGLIYALEAVKNLKHEGSRFEFRIVGDGPLRPAIEKAIADWGLQDCARLLGFLDYAEYLAELQTADIFIQPSVTAADGDSEGGAPTTILEAQAAGLPVAATRHADIPNVVVPGVSALLSDEKDVPALTASIRHLLQNQDQWEAMGRAGRKFVETNHQIQVEIDNLEAIYSSLLRRAEG